MGYTGPLSDKDRIFTNLYGFQSPYLKAAEARGDWDNTKALMAHGQDAIIDKVKASGLRGRGGAGFPTGMKWGFMPKEPKPGKPNFLVINADESEPGSCKDREIIRHDPHKLIEGALIAGFAMRARAAYIYIRGEFIRETEVLRKAVAEAYEAGLLGKNACGSGYDFDLFVHRGAGAYICGEETAMLESLEGKKGWPRLKPPFPAGAGLYGCPTTVNNVEMHRGRADHPAPQPAMVRGHRQSQERRHQAVPAVGPRQHPVHGRGIDGHRLSRADRPPRRRDPRRLGQSAGGDPGRIFGAAGAGCRRSWMRRWISTASRRLGSGLGTAAVIVMDKTTDIVRAISRISYFYKHESCGQCTPCREGTGWMWRMMERLRAGDAEVADIDKLIDVTKQVEGHTICALGDAAAWPIQGLVRHFRPELERRIAERTARGMLEAAE